MPGTAGALLNSSSDSRWWLQTIAVQSFTLQIFYFQRLRKYQHNRFQSSPIPVRACSAGRGTIEPEVEGFPKSLSPKGRLGLRIVRQAAGTQRLRSEYFGYFGFFVAAEIFSYEIALRETGLKYERLSNRPQSKAKMS
jgi:hypothetical protein